jgi:NADP-dependent aldehyde dehydrogenase
MNDTMQPVLIAGMWRAAEATGSFRGVDPMTRKTAEAEFPLSAWSDVDAALDAAQSAFEKLAALPGEKIAAFLEAYAAQIEQEKDKLVEAAHAETGYPRSPRLADVELPRTTNQLRLAAQAARTENWRTPILDTKANLRSARSGIGPVVVMGPNNFPFAFGSVSGGDFAAAIAAHCPVIAKAHPSHPKTTQLFAEAAHRALHAAGLPLSTVQVLYGMDPSIGLRMVADPRVGATAFTGSRRGGLALKEAADRAGKPIYLEMSSVNPVAVLPGALKERGAELADEFVASVLMGAGQFCTNPGVVLLVECEQAQAFVDAVAQKFDAAPGGCLLNEGVLDGLSRSVEAISGSGARVLTTGGAPHPTAYSAPNVLLEVGGDAFLQQPEKFQREAFGNAALIVRVSDATQLAEICGTIEGSLTACVYSAKDGADDATYDAIEPLLRRRCGRLLNDKMPTGVAVSPAMNHGGPYPSTGHPGFTAVGIPTSIVRFTTLDCYDAVRPHRLPPWLADEPGIDGLWRLVDGEWKQS